MITPRRKVSVQKVQENMENVENVVKQPEEIKRFYGQFISVVDEKDKKNGKGMFKIKFKGLDNNLKPLVIDGEEFVQIGTLTVPEGFVFDDYLTEDGNSYIFTEEDIFSVKAKLIPYTGDKLDLDKIWVFELFEKGYTTKQEDVDKFMKLI